MIETCTKNRNTVGIIDLMQFNPRFRRAEVGIVIFPPFRHLGYAKDALSILCDYALCYLHIHQLYAYISVRNTASQKLFQNMGFQRTAVLSDWLFINGAYEDVALFQKIW